MYIRLLGHEMFAGHLNYSTHGPLWFLIDYSGFEMYILGLTITINKILKPSGVAQDDLNITNDRQSLKAD